MIPHRMLTSEVCGSGLRDRVVACRKRLRVKRTTQRTSINGEVRELFPETVPSVAEFNEYAAGNLPECAAISTSAARADYRSHLAVTAADDGESSLLGEQQEEQEVGIT